MAAETAALLRKIEQWRKTDLTSDASAMHFVIEARGIIKQIRSAQMTEEEKLQSLDVVENLVMMAKDCCDCNEDDFADDEEDEDEEMPLKTVTWWDGFVSTTPPPHRR